MQPLIAFDQLLNTFVWIRGDADNWNDLSAFGKFRAGFGWADETLSARLWRLYLQDVLSDKPYKFVDALFFWEQAHCYESWMSEVNRRQLDPHYLTPLKT